MQVLDTSALASFLNREAPSILCTLNAQDTLTFFLPCSRLVYRWIFAIMLTKPPVVGDLDILPSGGTAAWWVQDSNLEEAIANSPLSLQSKTSLIFSGCREPFEI